MYLFIYLAVPGLNGSMQDLLVNGIQDQVPWPGIEPQSLDWEHGVLATGQPGKSPDYFLNVATLPLQHSWYLLS